MTDLNSPPEHSTPRSPQPSAPQPSARQPFDPQNPDPSEVAGLEPGGGVDPGDTPPAESSVGGPQHEPPQRSRFAPILIFALVGLFAVLIAAGLVGRIFGLV